MCLSSKIIELLVFSPMSKSPNSDPPAAFSDLLHDNRFLKLNLQAKTGSSIFPENNPIRLLSLRLIILVKKLYVCKQCKVITNTAVYYMFKVSNITPIC